MPRSSRQQEKKGLPLIFWFLWFFCCCGSAFTKRSCPRPQNHHLNHHLPMTWMIPSSRRCPPSRRWLPSVGLRIQLVARQLMMALLRQLMQALLQQMRSCLLRVVTAHRVLETHRLPLHRLIVGHWICQLGCQLLASELADWLRVSPRGDVCLRPSVS